MKALIKYLDSHQEWPSVSILFLHEIASLDYGFYLTEAARKIISKDLFVGYTLHFGGRLKKQIASAFCFSVLIQLVGKESLSTASSLVTSDSCRGDVLVSIQWAEELLFCLADRKDFDKRSVYRRDVVLIWLNTFLVERYSKLLLVNIEILSLLTEYPGCLLS